MADDPFRAGVLIEATELSSRLAAGDKPKLLDVRVASDDGDGRPEYLASHIVGAVFVDLVNELAGEPGGVEGRRPLPDPAFLQRDARRWGLTQDAEVVVYDGSTGQRAGRAWWLLRWGGLRRVRLLNGGFKAWVELGGTTCGDVPLPAWGDVVITPGHMPVVDADAAAALARASRLLDARGKEPYEKGHIPGAIGAPTSENLGSDARVLPAKLLRARFRRLIGEARDGLAVSCGGGISAAHQIAILASLGVQAALYPPSWSGWSADLTRPVSRGSSPG